MIRLAFKNVYRKKVRTLIVILGIGIAVTGFIGLLSFSYSLKSTFHESLESIQGITVMQKGALDYPFSVVDESDAEKMLRVNGISLAVPQVGGIVARIDGKELGFNIAGMVSFVGEPPEKAEQERTGLVKHNVYVGRYLRAGDKKAAVIGKKVADDYNKKPGSMISVNGEQFNVVGVYSSGTDMLDSMIVIPLDAARKMAGLPKGKVNAFYLEVEEPKKAAAIADVIDGIFPEYDASSSSDYAQEMGSVLSQVDTFFIAVAGIAILIGGIGILNTMIMSVAERRKEFGVLRAMGWTDDNVMGLVIRESAILGIAGGVFGMALSVLAISAASSVMPFKVTASPGVFALGFLISIVLGVAGGAYPAWRASKLEPTLAMKD